VSAGNLSGKVQEEEKGSLYLMSAEDDYFVFVVTRLVFLLRFPPDDDTLLYPFVLKLSE
jgi:hypothetical protein